MTHFSTDIRLSKHRLEKLRQEHGSSTDHGETYKGFPYAYWAFSRQAIPQSLSKMPEVDEQVALQVFQSILTYAGLGQDGKTYALFSFPLLHISITEILLLDTGEALQN
jgi:hypothetical protein